MFKNIFLLSFLLIPSLLIAAPKNIVIVDLKDKIGGEEVVNDVSEQEIEKIEGVDVVLENEDSSNVTYNIEVKVSNNKTLETKFNLSVRGSLNHPISTFSGAKKPYPLEDTGNMQTIPFEYSYGSLITFDKAPKNNNGVVLLARVEAINKQELDVKSPYRTVNRHSSYSFFDLKEGENSFRVNDKKYEFNLIQSN